MPTTNTRRIRAREDRFRTPLFDIIMVQVQRTKVRSEKYYYLLLTGSVRLSVDEVSVCPSTVIPSVRGPHLASDITPRVSKK